MSRNILKSSAIIGHKVQNSDGENIGTIKDLVIIQNEGVAFLILSYNAIPGIEKKLIAVPIEIFGFTIIERAIMNEIVVFLNIKKEKLENAPEFDKEISSVNPEFVDSVYTYFGLDYIRRSKS